MTLCQRKQSRFAPGTQPYDFFPPAGDKKTTTMLFAPVTRIGQFPLRLDIARCYRRNCQLRQRFLRGNNGMPCEFSLSTRNIHLQGRAQSFDIGPLPRNNPAWRNSSIETGKEQGAATQFVAQERHQFFKGKILAVADEEYAI